MLVLVLDLGKAKVSAHHGSNLAHGPVDNGLYVFKGLKKIPLKKPKDM